MWTCLLTWLFLPFFSFNFFRPSAARQAHAFSPRRHASSPADRVLCPNFPKSHLQVVKSDRRSWPVPRVSKKKKEACSSMYMSKTRKRYSWVIPVLSSLQSLHDCIHMRMSKLLVGKSWESPGTQPESHMVHVDSTYQQPAADAPANAAVAARRTCHDNWHAG